MDATDDARTGLRMAARRRREPSVAEITAYHWGEKTALEEHAACPYSTPLLVAAWTAGRTDVRSWLGCKPSVEAWRVWCN